MLRAIATISALAPLARGLQGLAGHSTTDRALSGAGIALQLRLPEPSG